MPIVNGVQTPGTIGRGHHLGEPLTCDQIRALPDRAEIVVTWDGGNGPWPERVLVDRQGTRRVEGLYCDQIIHGWSVVPLHRVTLGWDEPTRAWARARVPEPEHIQRRWAQLRGEA